MGGIDTDPATTKAANKKFIRAPTIYTKEKSGLRHKWFGGVFLNPPYSGLGAVFCRKLVKEFRARRTTQAIILIGTWSVHADWLWDLRDLEFGCGVICLVRKPLKWWGLDAAKAT